MRFLCLSQQQYWYFDYVWCELQFTCAQDLVQEFTSSKTCQHGKTWSTICFSCFWIFHLDVTFLCCDSFYFILDYNYQWPVDCGFTNMLVFNLRKFYKANKDASLVNLSFKPPLFLKNLENPRTKGKFAFLFPMHIFPTLSYWVLHFL